MDNIFFHVLYGVSAFFFAIIACRYMILSIKNFLWAKEKGSPSSNTIALILCTIIIATAWLGLPYFFSLRSAPALYIYLVSLIFFLALSYKKLKK